MKTIILLALFAFAAAEEYYDVEKVDISALKNNVGELKKFSDCLLEREPCNKVYESYRVILAESFQQACRKCSPEQKQFGSQFVQALKTLLPQDYHDLIQKYDPENKYLDALLAALN